MKSIFVNVIRRGGYDLTAMLRQIDSYHIEGKLSDEDREELYHLARKSAQVQYDVGAEIQALWAAIRQLQTADSGAGANDTWPEYVQPTGAHDAYQAGAQITFRGQRYRCVTDNCVWAPDVLPSAWEAVTGEDSVNV